MCGICGIVHPSPSRLVDETALAAMNRAMKHRGPNDEGMWVEGHVGLAMRRLSVIDVFRGRQPMQNEQGTVILVFNGEIYNYKSLRADLELKGYTFHTLSDTEVILRAYEEFGEDCVQHFNGMFAFAVYDRSRDRLFLARDRLGIKPLYYTFSQGSLIFASELDPLLRAGFISGEIDPAALDAYFTYLYVPGPATIFSGVYKLAPGEKLVYSRGQWAVEKYWSLSYRINPTWTLSSAAEEYFRLLSDAVAMQRVSDVPLGALLSGGVDSSSVVALLSQQTSAPIKTFTVGFGDAAYDEFRYARIAAQAFGTDHTETVLETDVKDMIPNLIPHFGEPFADSSALPTWLVSRVARQDVTVALAGDGGDELFAGYTWTHMTRRVEQYRRIPRWARHLWDALLFLAPRHPFVARMRRFSKDSFRSPEEVFRRRHTCFGGEMRAKLYNAETARAVACATLDFFQQHMDRCSELSFPDKMLYHDTVMYLPDDILTKVDRMSMAHSLEVRVPILDHRIVEFAATVPFQLKYRGATSKRLVKHGFRNILPPILLKQRKQGFAVPVHRWFRTELLEYFDATVLAPEARLRRFLSPEAVAKLRDTHVSGRENYGHHLWAILMFEHWLRYLETLPKVAPHVPQQV